MLLMFLASSCSSFPYSQFGDKQGEKFFLHPEKSREFVEKVSDFLTQEPPPSPREVLYLHDILRQFSDKLRGDDDSDVQDDDGGGEEDGLTCVAKRRSGLSSSDSSVASTRVAAVDVDDLAGDVTPQQGTPQKKFSATACSVLGTGLPPPFRQTAAVASVSDVAPQSTTPLSPENLFGPAWNTLPGWYPNELNKCLSYLNGCLSVEYLLNYFEKHWPLIRKNFHLLDTTFDVGSCHLQALVNFGIMMQYFSLQSQDIPQLIKIYIAICRMLSDFENKYGDGSVAYLHCPDHVRGMPENFPLKTRVDKKSGLSKPIGHNFFAGYLRSIAAMQALVLLKNDSGKIQPREIKSIGLLPRIPYPLSFEEVVRQMEILRAGYCVELVSVSCVPGNPALRLRDGHDYGICGEEAAVSRDRTAPMLVLQFYAVGCPDDAIAETLMQLKKFPVLRLTLAQTVFLAQGNSEREPIPEAEQLRLQEQIGSYRSAPVSGWLQKALQPEALRPFADKFRDRWIVELLNRQEEAAEELSAQGLRCGLGIRHVYLSTKEQFERERFERLAIVAKYEREARDHEREIMGRAEKREREGMEGAAEREWRMMEEQYLAAARKAAVVSSKLGADTV